MEPLALAVASDRSAAQNDEKQHLVPTTASKVPAASGSRPNRRNANLPTTRFTTPGMLTANGAESSHDGTGTNKVDPRTVGFETAVQRR